MDGKTLVQSVAAEAYYKGQLAHIQDLSAQPASFANLDTPLPAEITNALSQMGITDLYSHQAYAINAIHAGKSVVIVTATASGKTMCYNIPVVKTLLTNPLATALQLFPTKALAQDQLRSIGPLQKGSGADFLAGTYDGDTPQSLRRKLRNGGNVILTNPDMLHQGILPQHARWAKFFTHLKYVVIDELHAYRGIFGSHLANVIRRLRRICNHYGSTPQFICCSATIDNPREHAQRICGCDIEQINNDGAPRGPKRFVLWNPPPIDQAARGKADDWRAGGDRKSPMWEAVNLMTSLVKEGIQTIAFTRTRLSAELIYKNTRDMLRATASRKLAESVAAYRGGYLPEERREIERKLAAKEIIGLASTNALELGIDIGSLDACIMVGYPGTISSMWQQAGRAGRGLDEAVVFLIAQNSPIDQYLMVHSQYLFSQNPEQAIVDPDNPHIAIGHLRCAAHELPLSAERIDDFGQYGEVVMELLEEDHAVKRIDNHWYWSSTEYPAAEVNLRNIAGPVYTIQDTTGKDRVIGTVDEISALSQLHDHAVYLHQAETYFVTRLDLEQKIAFVEKTELDYYTQSVQTSQIAIDEEQQTDSLHEAKLGFGDVTVTTSIPMFKKIRFHSRESLGFEQLELPPQTLETVAMWFIPPAEIVSEMQEKKMLASEGLIGIANVLVEVASLFTMSDSQDIGAVVDSSCLGADALFLYDRYPGGMGYAKRCLDRIADILMTVRDVINDCSCPDGCPSCVGAAVPAFALSDIDSAVRGRIPDKSAAIFLLNTLLG